MLDIEEQIRSAMQIARIIPPSNIYVDGKKHRFSTNNNPRDTSGEYCFYSDHCPAGYFKDWRSGVFQKWHLNLNNSCIKYSNLKESIENKQKSLLLKRQEQKIVANDAVKLWKVCVSASSNHPYLIKKDIDVLCARQLNQNTTISELNLGNKTAVFSFCLRETKNIILPIVDYTNNLWSLQFINPEGKKLFLSGGAKRGNFIPVQGWINNKEILIGEGFATCATLAMEYPSKCVVAALDAGNLEVVALSIAAFNPQADIIICGDDDRQTPGNPGATKARRAAIASGARLALPVWPSNAPLTLTDFNDLKCWLKCQAKVEL